ncbi:hypothetical protein HPP92_028194 [Vanilla planifolia]|uniref:3-hydroxyisobutyrate dehydrogenase n=1 Tax=Vanilla planifolia TaxID=51239 RepID=A0A835P704_VANPL|nr:hypothetical protein HPP92_028194 [Vanilla planifolia]KAG0447810.1 hypothetical protein HPP92_028174 [Vanilla planifolia]
MLTALRTVLAQRAISVLILRSRSFSSSVVPSSLERVGFIGLGNMGFHMANNLINAGYKLTVHDIDENVMKKFSERGIFTSKTPSEVADKSDVVITMLPSSPHFLALNKGFNLHSLDEDTSGETLLPGPVFAGSADKPTMLDAPVSGGVLGAAAGTLTFMVGGLEDAYIAAKPLFLAMGKSSIYCGGPGNGAHARVSEALALGQHLGITASTLTNIFNSSTARCWSSDTYNPVPGVMEGVPSSRSYDGGFSSKLMAKDLMLAKASAEETQQNCPLTSEALKIYLEVCNNGHESKDFSCVFQHYYSGRDS